MPLRKGLSLIIAILASAACAHAQVSHGPPVNTPHSCDVAVNRLAADPHSAAFRAALLEGRLHLCGERGAVALGASEPSPSTAPAALTN